MLLLVCFGLCVVCFGLASVRYLFADGLLGFALVPMPPPSQPNAGQSSPDPSPKEFKLRFCRIPQDLQLVIQG